MNTIKGPGLFLAQFIRDIAPYNSIEGLAKWASNLGFKGFQVPTWDAKIFDLELAAQSQSYCDQYKGVLNSFGIELIEIASYLQGQVLALHPAYKELFQGFFPNGISGIQRQEWATDQLLKTIKASSNLGLKNISVMSGGFAWHLAYPWPQRPEGLIDEAMTELARLWLPILNKANDYGITFGYELHPGSDLFDGATYEWFLDKVNQHSAACLTYDPSHFLLQQLDYLEFIKIYGERIEAFHVKDAEFNPTGKVGVYGGYQQWSQRAGRFRSPGDGQIDFKRIFTLLTEANYKGWAVLEWECCVKSPEAGAKEGAQFIKEYIIEATDVFFDDFAKSSSNHETNRRILGINN